QANGHSNPWKWLTFTYHMHWVHEGGEHNVHPVQTLNDVAHAAGIGFQSHPFGSPSLTVGGSYTHLHSHQRQDSQDPALRFKNNGGGDLFQVHARWGRIMGILGDWRGHGFSHEGGDP